MTTTPQEPAAEPSEGFVLRGGPLDGTVVHEQRPAFVHIERYDGSGDVYRSSGHLDEEHQDLERYDFEEISASR
jgi:hypothetical protein